MSVTAFEEDRGRPCVETLAVAEIKQDSEIAARDLDPDIVAEYAERMQAGDVFPPLRVMRDADGTRWLVEGWRRLDAARWNKIESIRCEIQEGDRRAALLASAGVNATHGLRRTNEDKQRAVLKLLEDREWSRWSDREIARQCKVSPTFVGAVRATVHADSDDGDRRRYRSKHGNLASMNVSAIGKPKVEERYIAQKGRPFPVVVTEETIKFDVPYTSGPTRSVKLAPERFTVEDMDQLERLIGRAHLAEKRFAHRLRVAARKLAKAVEQLGGKRGKPGRRRARRA
jgi:hypothetical protein